MRIVTLFLALRASARHAGRPSSRRRKSHGLRIRDCRKSRECLLAFDCSSSPNRSRGFGLGNGGGGTENIADLQITTLKSKRLLPSRFKVGKLTFRTRFSPAAPLPPSPQRPPHRGCRGTPLPRSFPGFSRARETGPPEAIPAGEAAGEMDHTCENCISVRCVPSSGAPRQLPPGEARVLAAPASGFFQRGPSSPVPAARSAFSLRLIPRARAPHWDVCVPRSGAALTCHRHVIHSRAPASQPQGKPGQ